MAKKPKKPKVSKRNPVAKNAHVFNRAKVFKDRKKEAKRDNYGEDDVSHWFLLGFYTQKKVDTYPICAII